MGEAAKASGGVIRSAHNHEFEYVGRDVVAAEVFAAIRAIGEALTGTGNPSIVKSAAVAPTEAEDGDPGHVHYPAEQATLAMAALGGGLLADLMLDNVVLKDLLGKSRRH